MEMMTAEQAAEAAKGLTFEKVWAALMESRQRMEERMEESDRRREEADRRREEEDRKIKESSEKFEREMKESHERLEKSLDKANKIVGGLGNSLGHLVEALFSPKLCEKFEELGYTFHTQARNKQFYRDVGKTLLAEVDSVLENGEYVMLVEVKTHLSEFFVEKHLSRIGKIRQYMDDKGDDRKIVGAVAGGVIDEGIVEYAQSEGLYVLVQTGDIIEVANTQESFKAREW